MKEVARKNLKELMGEMLDKYYTEHSEIKDDKERWDTSARHAVADMYSIIYDFPCYPRNFTYMFNRKTKNSP